MKKYLPLLLFFVIPFSNAPAYAHGAISPTDLKTEWMVNPLGVDVLKPGLSWVLTSSERGQSQLGYQILVASSEASLAADNGDVWNSGHINSGEQTNIIYKGPALSSDSRYFWKVKVWDKNNIASDWSAMAFWEMGLLKGKDMEGKWICTSTEKESPLFRKDFTITKSVKKATAHVYGLGWYEMHLNGKKVGDQVLTPANTDYSKRILYDSYDVTNYLKEGGNAVGLWLSNGYGPDYSKYGWRWMDSKRAVLQMNIEFTDGSKMSIITDETWKTDDSQISSAGIYSGETYDATKEKTGWDVNGYNDTSWENVAITSAPPGKMESNMSTPVRVAKIMKPVSVKQTASGSYIFDLGQNIAGWVRLHISGATRGVKIEMHHAEAEKSDGTLETFTNRDARATDTYICKGGTGEETYEPRFTYHGFRYVEVTGFPGTPSLSSLEGCALHSDVEFTGSFFCSDSLINQIHSNFQWTILNNMVSIPTDNPVRDERTPCQMDENCIYEAAIQNFDVQQYFKNWLGNIFESTSNPDWSSGQVLGPWLVYQYYGDKRILETFYSSSKKEVDYCLANAVKSNYWSGSFGDWCTPNTDGSYKNSFSEGEIVNTSLYYYITNLMSRIAGILGKTQDSTYYASKANSIMTTFNVKHFNSSANIYGTGKQITYIMPLMSGMVPANKQSPVFDKLVGNITGECSGHFGTGIYGTSFLPDLLCDHGRADVAFRLFTQTTYPSFGYQIKSFGATTVWEQWGAPVSGGEMETFDHAMYSGADKTFYTRFGGIRPLTAGYKTISIKPCIPDSLDFVKSSVKTVKGLITSNWNKSGGIYTHFITIPVNTTAIVQIPGTDPGKVYENGVAASKAKGVYYLRTDKNYVVYKVLSGSYFFSYGIPNSEAQYTKTEWVSSTEKMPWVSQKADITKNSSVLSDVELVLNKPLQTIEGFGACFNELGWTSLNMLSEKDKDYIFKELFEPGFGAGFNICRMPVGANDFSRDWYSYDETEGDFAMNSFNIKNDLQTLVPFIKEAQKYKPDLKLWASPWSPPSWMKWNKHYACRVSEQTLNYKFKNGLDPQKQGKEGTNMFIQKVEYFRAYSLYFARFIEAYQNQGIKISTIMPQNEFNSCQIFPSCTWTASGLAEFIGNYLGPRMKKQNVEVMFGTMERPAEALADTILSDKKAGQYITGIGFQWAGKEAIAGLHKRYPALKLYQTEQECGDGKNDWNYCNYAWELMKHYFNNGVSSYMYWNISLEKGGFSRWGWQQNSLITVDAQSKTYHLNHEYFLMKHLSHYVKSGAKMISLSGSFTNMLAFLNPDKSVVIILQNETNDQTKITIKIGDSLISSIYKPHSFNTIMVY